MRIEGTLGKWNDDRGFGFIAPRQGGPEVFVHISAFPKDGRRPTVGELLTFEIEVDGNGKKRARMLLRPARPSAPTSRPTAPIRHVEKPGILGRLVPLVVLSGLAFYGYGHYSGRIAPQRAIAEQPNYSSRMTPQREVAEQPSSHAASTSFRCDGRIHCSQMTSCAEATFFLRNCSGVRMDGDHDGIPCEEQWCR